MKRISRCKYVVFTEVQVIIDARFVLAWNSWRVLTSAIDVSGSASIISFVSRGHCKGLNTRPSLEHPRRRVGIVGKLIRGR